MSYVDPGAAAVTKCKIASVLTRLSTKLDGLESSPEDPDLSPKFKEATSKLQTLDRVQDAPLRTTRAIGGWSRR